MYEEVLPLHIFHSIKSNLKRKCLRNWNGMVITSKETCIKHKHYFGNKHSQKDAERHASEEYLCLHLDDSITLEIGTVYIYHFLCLSVLYQYTIHIWIFTSTCNTNDNKKMFLDVLYPILNFMHNTLAFY